MILCLQRADFNSMVLIKRSRSCFANKCIDTVMLRSSYLQTCFTRTDIRFSMLLPFLQDISTKEQLCSVAYWVPLSVSMTRKLDRSALFPTMTIGTLPPKLFCSSVNHISIFLKDSSLVMSYTITQASLFL